MYLIILILLIKIILQFDNERIQTTNTPTSLTPLTSFTLL